MEVKELIKVIDSDFYTGVPDSQLRSLCDYLIDTYGIDKKHHVIGVNEGNCVALAAGYHLATGKVPVVYMQNSGEGNIINPVASLLNDKVYAIPMIFIIGWRGEPGIHDEPQHIYQGEVTIKLLDVMGIDSFVISKDTTINELNNKMEEFKKILSQGKNVAFVIKKGSLDYSKKVVYQNNNKMNREEIINHIVQVSGEDPIISTTGKASRELFEIREKNHQSHKYDFLTVGSMGHSSTIGLGIAINKPNNKVWCIDGDGAALMHLGSMSLIGSIKPNNMIHILINNGAHETVGGMPTVATNIDFIKIAEACGYENVISVSSFKELDRELMLAKKNNSLTFIEVKCSIGARDNLGRPTISAIENKNNFVSYLNEL